MVNGEMGGEEIVFIGNLKIMQSSCNKGWGWELSRSCSHGGLQNTRITYGGNGGGYDGNGD